MERFNGTAVLDNASLDAVNGGTTVVGVSLANQQAIALRQQLTEIYLRNHPVELGPAYVLDR